MSGRHAHDTDPFPGTRAALGSLTLEQKVALLSGRTFWRLPGEPAVGLREIVMSDGPVGVRGERWDERDHSLTIPSPTSLSASWDPELVGRLGSLLATEARRKHVDVLLAPTVNIHRSPYGGRHFECYSEDPLLTATVGRAYVTAVQAQGVAATVKHYVANDAETARQTVDNRIGQQALREVYLAPFEAIVAAGVWAVMSAYNGVNGAPMTENPLLAEPLKGEWGFDGVVVSDWFAVYDTVRAGRAAQDVEMPGPTAHWGAALVEAVRAGEVPEAAVDDKVERVLRLAARVGALEGTAPTEPDPVDDPRALIRRAAAAGAVLVSNDGTLPLDADTTRSVALLGPSAAVARIQGGGSAGVFPRTVVSPREGLARALDAAGVELTHTPGVFVDADPSSVDTSQVTDPVDGTPGLRLRWFDAEGNEIGSEHRLAGRLQFDHESGVLDTAARIEVEAVLRADEDGGWLVGVGGSGHFGLEVDGDPVLDLDLRQTGYDDPAAGLLAQPWATHPLTLTAGQPVHLRATRTVPDDAGHFVTLDLGVRRPRRSDADELAAAVRLAADADVAVVVVGTTSYDESEGFDRSTLALPGPQDELVRQVAAANPRTVVVVNSGSPVLLPWRDDVAAVLLAWFPGQEAGDALADVLLGRAEPGGRLPTTWPAEEADLPVADTRPTDGRLVYDEGVHVGYRAWLRSGRTPAYWFGHGLGYTTWELDEPTATARGVSVALRNTGDRTGRQVVQVYLSRPGSAVERPQRWLAGWAAATLEPGARQVLDVDLPVSAFRHWDGAWQVEPGTYTAHVGFSAVDLPARLDVEAPTP